jgi:hypothetical protein
MTIDFGRRRLLAAFGGAPVAWPLAAQAEQTPRLRRLGILMPFSPIDKVWQSRVDALRQELQRLGWTQGSNIETLQPASPIAITNATLATARFPCRRL